MTENAIPNGTRINERYVISEVIGEGGGGIVYKAFDVNLQSYVVVKQIKDNMSSLLESRTEVDALKRLKHERLPKVLDFFEAEGKVYTVMDLIQGTNLSTALRFQGRYLQKDVLRWARQLAGALAYLHSQTPPVIHSDIKPGNIMMNPQTGDVCLIDFNISLAFNKRNVNATWVSGGYSPPEQYRSLEDYYRYIETARRQQTQSPYTRSRVYQGSMPPGSGTAPTRIFDRNTVPIVERTVGRGLDTRSDIYSFGATLYHLLTGIKPDIDFRNIVPISMFDIDLSEGFCHIIEKCMQLDPAQRYQDGMELDEAFRNIYELDSEYRNYKKGTFVRKLVSSMMIAGGAALAVTGFLINKNDVTTRYNQLVVSADTQMSSQDFSGAEKTLETAENLSPNRLDAYERAAANDYRSGKYDEAIQSAQNTLNNQNIRITDRDSQTLGDLYYILGNAYLENESYSDSADAFRKALDLNKSNNLYFRDYAICLARSGNVDEAKKILSQAVSANLNNDSVTYTLGEIAYAEEKYTEAGNDFAAVLGATEDESLQMRSVLMIADVYEKLNDPDGMISFLEQKQNAGGMALQMRVTKRLGDAWILKGNQDASAMQNCDEKALGYYEILYKGGYKTADILQTIAVLQKNLVKYSEAEQTLKEMVSLFPNDYRGYKQLALLYAAAEGAKAEDQRDYTNFKDNYEKALQLYQSQQDQSDPDMQELTSLYQSAQAGGWIS